MKYHKSMPEDRAITCLQAVRCHLVETIAELDKMIEYLTRAKKGVIKCKN